MIVEYGYQKKYKGRYFLTSILLIQKRLYIGMNLVSFFDFITVNKPSRPNTTRGTDPNTHYFIKKDDNKNVLNLQNLVVMFGILL